jgi:hypothetical protein
MSLTPSSEFVTTSHLPDTRKHRAPPLGLLFLLRDISTKNPLFSKLPTPAYVSPSAFLTLPTIYSFSYLAGLFHPPTTSEILSSGVLLPIVSRPNSSPARTLLPFVPFSCRRVTPTAPDRETRLQGFNPTTGPLPLTGGLDLPAPRSPLEFSLPRAFLQTPCDYPRSLSAHDLWC